MFRRTPGLVLGCLVVFGLLLSACGGDVPTITPVPTATVPPASPTPAFTPTPTSMTPAQITRSLRTATVWVESTFGQTAIQPEGIGAGTGIVYDLSNGYILTNNHVVEGASAIQIYQANSTQGRPARVVGRAQCDDLAVLKVDDTSGMSQAPLGDSSSLEPGDSVVALGYPQAFQLGNDLTVSAGVVSKLHERQYEYQDLIQTDANITHGNSGGPLVNDHGQVVGINTLGFIDANGQSVAGINFAIAMSYARPIVKDLQGGKNRNYLGLNLYPNQPNYKKYFGTDDGMVIIGVSSGSPGDAAGVVPSDLLLKIENTSISYQNNSPLEKQVCDILRSHTDGDPLKLTVQRLQPAQYMEGEVTIGKAGASTSKLASIGPVSTTGQDTPTAGSGGGTYTSVVQTDFTKGEKGTWDTTSGISSTRTLANGRFTLRLTDSNLWAVSFPDTPTDLGDGAIVATVQPHGSGGRSGVVGRSFSNKGALNSYYCFITQDGQAGCDKEVVGNWSNVAPVQANSAVKPKAYNKLTLAITGSQVVFQVNDQTVAKFTDSSLTSGAWGMAADTDEKTSSFEAYFGAVEIDQLK